MRRPERAVGDRGVALASAVFIGSIALLLLAVVIARGVASSNVAANQIDWEVALNIAEGELDAYLADLFTQTDPDAVSTGHLLADLTDRTAVVSAAEALAVAQPADVVDAPGGEVVILKPSDSPVVFSVGFVPDMATDGRKVRIVSAGYESTTTTINDVEITFGVFGGGDISISGSASIESSGSDPADVHANGTLSPGSVSRIPDGCGTESDDGGYNQPGCTASPVAELPTPQIEAIVYHELSWYDLCPDGAHFGPNHPTSPGGVAGTPCSGPLTSTPSGWTGGGASWSINNTITGVFFVSGADITGKPRSGTLATLVAHRTYGAGETPGTCGQGTGGSIDLSTNSWLTGHPDTGSPPIAAVADGDIAIPNSDVVGLIAAGETFEGTGPGTLNIEGAIVVTDRCDEGLNFNGNITITYTGPFSTLFDATTTSSTSNDFDITLRDEV
jgi:hypothetical protein